VSRVLIAGCGYVGTALGLRLAAGGAQVWGLRRSPGGLPDPITPIAGDLTDPATTDLVPDVDAVVIATSADRRDPDAYRRAYIDGPVRLLDGLMSRPTPPDRVLVVSSTAVYGQTDGAWVDETSPAAPSTATGQVVLDAEAAVARAADVTIVRFAGIYGPGRTRLIDQVRAGEATCPPEPAYTNRIHRDDCAGGLEHLLRLDVPQRLYIGVDDDPADRCEVLRWLADRLGAPPPTVTDDGSGRRGSKRCSNARLRASGYRMRYPSFRDGYADMLTAGRDG
jgi:nucleoside-diphosphate-sugar epimerase